MADKHETEGAPPAAAPRNLTGIGVIVLAALVVAAVIAFFLFGTSNAPGPLADAEPGSSETAQAFADTNVVPAPVPEAETTAPAAQ